MTTTVLETMRTELRQKMLDLRGTPAFAEVLAERERALGLMVAPAIGAVWPTTAVPSVTTTETTETTGDESADAPCVRVARDRFGNRILDDPPGRFGQYRIVSARNGGVARVCGEAETTKHLPYWEYDEGERRFVCAVCFPTRQLMARDKNEGTSHV